MSETPGMWPDEVAAALKERDDEVSKLRRKLAQIKEVCTDLWDTDTGHVCAIVINIVEKEKE